MSQAEEWRGVARVNAGLCGVLCAGGARQLMGLFDEERTLRPPTAWPLTMAPGTPGSIHQRSRRVTSSPMDSCTLEWECEHFITWVIRSIVHDYLDTVASPPAGGLHGVLENEPWMSRKVLIVAPAIYPISYCPRKRALRITTSSDGGAGTSTSSCSGTTDSGASSCCWLELAACHVWYCVRCLALFRSPPPFYFKYIYIWGNSLFLTYCYCYSFFNIYLHIHMFTYISFIPRQLFILLL
jgi:hypothetical protein